MKKLKKILLYCLLFVFALPMFVINKPTNNTYAAPTGNIYATISVSGQVIETSSLETVDGITYITTNSSTTISLNYLNYNYLVQIDNPSSFYTNKITKTLPLDSDDGSIELSGIVFNYRISEDTIVFSKEGSVVPTFRSDFGNTIEFVNDAASRTVSFITSFTLDETAPTSTLSYSVYQNQAVVSGVDPINLCFLRPIVNFNVSDAISFECVGLDAGDDPFVEPKIPKEHSFGNVKLSFTNNDYTETNPLYFDINHNGFIYTFKLFSKEIESSNLLFVEYFDTQKPKNNKSLATILREDGTVEYGVPKYVNGSDFNEFLIDFNRTGRYEVQVYDNTYKMGLQDCNFYSTSFYIKNEDNQYSAFENVYAIFQTVDNDNSPINYVVSESTLNNNVKITIKNLKFYFSKDTVLQDDDVVLDFRTTISSGSSNIPTTISYTKAQLLQILGDGEDFVKTVSEDAFYEITLYQWHVEERLEDGVTVSERVQGGEVGNQKFYQYFNFSIVKAPKISYTKYATNSEHEVLYDENGEPLRVTKNATVPYKVVRDHNNYRNIKSNMSFTIKYTSIQNVPPVTLEKAYINNYWVDYAMQETKVEEGVEYDKDGYEVGGQLVLDFYGIGDIEVTVTVNGKTEKTVLTEETGYRMIFKEYGTYKISFVDSMGTLGSATFPWEKPVSMSSVILIALLGVIALGIGIFIILARGKVKTR